MEQRKEKRHEGRTKKERKEESQRKKEMYLMEDGNLILTVL
jgi:hypothetical protein